MSSKWVYDYYTVTVPGDLADTLYALAEQAIREAEERTKLYCLPCIWNATRVRGDVGSYEVTFRVCRKRARKV
jgi:hypothetical protein